ncbi:MAG: hypothetical protein FJ197_05885 [Gammaproteobacteria bacterium]|nr:hypothetical protein [Gammaproteobacteria bacterium]
MAYEIPIPEDTGANFNEYLETLRRRKGASIKIAAVLLLFGVATIWLLPNTYRSTATILIEDPEVPPSLVQTTVTTFAARQIQYINQRVMTRTNLAQIIEKFNLYEEERKYLPTLLLVDEVQEDVKIDLVDVKMEDPSGRGLISPTIAFTLGFEHEQPAVARQVANELVSLYLAENVRSRTEQTAETSQFIQSEVDRLDGEVRGIEADIAKVKQDNEGSIPMRSAFNVQFLQRFDDDLNTNERDIRELESQKVLLDAQLAQLEPMQTVVTSEGRPVAAPADQLRAAQSQLSILEARYATDHPDVLRTRREVEALKQQVGQDLMPNDTFSRLTEARTQLAKARETYSDEHPEVLRLRREVTALESQFETEGLRPRVKRSAQEPTNPVYIEVLARRKQLDARVSALQDQRGQIRGKIAEYERNVGETTETERQLLGLDRKLQTATASYEAARARLFAAQMGQSLETQSKGERFTLVEPPDLPLLPASPNRPVLLVLLILLVLATGFGWPQVAESMDNSITSARTVERVAGSPPLAEIPFIQNWADIVRKRNILRTALVAVPTVLVILAVIVHFFYLNLDVIWYIAIRRMGM